MHTFLGMDGVGRALDFPQDRGTLHCLRTGGGARRVSGGVEGMGVREELDILNSVICKAIKYF